MIEIPEAVNLSRQFTETVGGKKIAKVVAGYSPHKFAWYHGDPKNYNAQLSGKSIGTTAARGGIVEIRADDVIILFSDGVALRFHNIEEPHPKKHQLLMGFVDGTAISASVQMYGGLICFKEGEYDNPYYTVAKDKPSPLSDEFDQDYFTSLISSNDVQNLSVKAFLATEQRIPGLGNGVLQDILYNARIHPKRKIETLIDDEKESLYRFIKTTLKKMTDQGGRDTEKGLFGEPGGYRTKLSKNTVGKPCPVCGSMIFKQQYLGGSVYFCEGCQKV